MGSYDYNANPKILASQEGRKGGGKILELTEILDRLRGDSAPMLPRLRQEPWVDESYCWWTKSCTAWDGENPYE